MSWKRSKEQAENDVLDAANQLDPNDQSPRAQQIRDTAEDIQDPPGFGTFPAGEVNQGWLWLVLSIGLPVAGVVVGTIVRVVLRVRDRRK